MPLTETGFEKRTYDEIIEDKTKNAQDMLGADIDTSDLSILGKLLRINAYDQALTEEETEQIYLSIFPNTAVGVSLDRLCVFAGITRNAAKKSKYVATITGTAETLVPYGFLVGTESGINFEVIGAATVSENGEKIVTVEGDVTIGENGTVDVTVECVESGEIGNIISQEINTIVNPSADIESVVGKNLLLKGEETESDYELRTRFKAAREGSGSCNEAAIKAALLRIPGITHAGVIVNETDEIDEAGRPPRSFECFVNGADDDETKDLIANTIFEKKAMGIKTFGNIEHVVIDEGDYEHIINFSYTTNAPVYVRLTIKTSAEFEGEAGRKEIATNIKTYIDSVGLGKPVVVSSLYGQIHSVTGVEDVTELLMSIDGNEWSTNKITVDAYEICVCKEVQIKLNDESDYEVIT